jgi:hypothetical protein
MMLDPGCTAGRTISARPVRGPEASSRMSLAILLRSRTYARSAPLSVAHRLHELDPVLPLPQLEAGHLPEVLDHQRGVLRLRVDAGPHRRAADVHLAEPVRGLRQLLPVALHRVTVRGELLAQPDRGGVLQVGAARLDDVVERRPLGQQRGGEGVERRERGGKRGQHREAHGGRDHIVGALRHVHVIVRVDRRVAPARLPQQLVGPVGQHLVYVHVVAGTRAGLIHVHDELIAMLPPEDLVGRRDDGVGQPRLEPAGLLVGQGRGALDPHDRVHEGRQRPEARDRKVLRRAQRLDAVQRVRGDGLLAERIAFEAGTGHGPVRFGVGSHENVAE